MALFIFINNEKYNNQDIGEIGTGSISEELIQKMAEKLNAVITRLVPGKGKPESKKQGISYFQDTPCSIFIIGF